MGFETFDFSLKKIKEQLDMYQNPEQKLKYLGFIKKELNRVIRCYQSDRFVGWRETSDDCKEKIKFYRERYKYLSRVYGEDDPRISEAIKEDVTVMIEELKDCLRNIKDEIDFISKYENVLKTDNPEKEKNDNGPKIDQESLIDKFKEECKKRQLVLYKTIPIKTLYEIAKKIGMKVGGLEEFKSRERNYQIARQYASLCLYKRKKPSER